MKKYVIVLCGAALVAAAAVSAFEIPGVGAKVDTKKFDELIASIEEVSGMLEVARGKIDVCHATLAEIATAHDAAELMSDPVQLAGLKDAITDEEKALVQAQAEIIQTVPDDLQAATEKATEITGKIPDALTELVDQISKNPMAAVSLKDKQEKLEDGKAALEEVVSEVPALVETATSLVSAVTGLL